MNPSADIARIAVNYTCSHCNSDPATLKQDTVGTWHLGIPHDDGCPVRAGIISAAPDVARAAAGPAPKSGAHA